MATPSKHAAKQPGASVASGAAAPHALRAAASIGRAVPLQGAELFAQRAAALGLRVELPHAPAGAGGRGATPAPGPATTPGNPLGTGPGPPGELPAFFKEAGPGSGDLLDWELDPGSAAASPNSDDLAAECSVSLSLSSPDSAARIALGLAPGEGWDPDFASEAWQAVPAVQAAMLTRQALKLLVAGGTPERVACCDAAWRGALFLEYLGFRLRNRSRYSFAADSSDRTPGPGSSPRSPPQPYSSVGGGGSGSVEGRAGDSGSGAEARTGASWGRPSSAAGRGGSDRGPGAPEGSDTALQDACAVASVQPPSPAVGVGGGWGREGCGVAPMGAGPGGSRQHLSISIGCGGGSDAHSLELSAEASVQHLKNDAPGSAPVRGTAPCPSASAASPGEPCAHASPLQGDESAGLLQDGAARIDGTDGAPADQGGARQECARALVTLQAPGGKPAEMRKRQPLLSERPAAGSLGACVNFVSTLSLTLAPAETSSHAVLQAGDAGGAPAAEGGADALTGQPPPLQHAESEPVSVHSLAAWLGQGAGAPAGQPDERSASVEPGQGASVPGAPEPGGTHGRAVGPSAASKALAGPVQSTQRGDSPAAQDPRGKPKSSMAAAAAAAEQHRPWWLPAPLLGGEERAQDLPPLPSLEHGAPESPAAAACATEEAVPPAELLKRPEAYFVAPQPASPGDSALEFRVADPMSHDRGGQPSEARHASPPLVPLPEHIVAGLQEASRAEPAQACGTAGERGVAACAGAGLAELALGSSEGAVGAASIALPVTAADATQRPVRNTASSNGSCSTGTGAAQGFGIVDVTPTVGQPALEEAGPGGEGSAGDESAKLGPRKKKNRRGKTRGRRKQVAPLELHGAALVSEAHTEASAGAALAGGEAAAGAAAKTPTPDPIPVAGLGGGSGGAAHEDAALACSIAAGLAAGGMTEAVQASASLSAVAVGSQAAPATGETDATAAVAEGQTQALPTHTKLLYGGLALGGALACLPVMGPLYMAWAGLQVAAGVANLLGTGLTAGGVMKRRGPNRAGHRGGKRERRRARGLFPFMGDPQGLYPENYAPGDAASGGAEGWSGAEIEEESEGEGLPGPEPSACSVR